MTKFIVNNRTDALKTDISLFLTITNCQIVRSCLLTHRIILNSCVCPLTDNGPFPKKLAPKTSLQGPLWPSSKIFWLKHCILYQQYMYIRMSLKSTGLVQTYLALLQHSKLTFSKSRFWRPLTVKWLQSTDFRQNLVGKNFFHSPW